MKPPLFFTAIIILLVSAGISSGEIIRLKNGTIRQGRIASEAKDSIRMIDASTNKEVNLKRADIANIVSEKAFDTVIDFGQLRRMNNDDWKKLEEKSKKAEEAKRETVQGKSFGEKYQPRLGLQGAYLMPTGDIGTALDPAIGFGLLFDMRMPLFGENSSGELRTGLSAGYAKFGSALENFPADVTIIPLLLNNELGYVTSAGFRPYLKLGAGVSMASLKDKSENTEKKDTSSMDLTVLAGAGAGYRNRKLPSLELFIEAGYLMLFEQTSGNFINISFGAAFHFNTKTGDQQ